MQSRFCCTVLTVAVAVISVSVDTSASSIPGFFFQCGGMQGADVLKCDGNNVILTSPDGGNVTLMAGAGGHVKIGDSVWNEGLSSSPPIWTKHFHGGNLGVYAAYSNVSVSIGAEDPEGGWVTYSVVSGSLPPGLELDSQTGQIKGTAPALQAMFSFSVQATDSDGRTTDATYTIDILESYYHCSGDPCNSNGTCIDRMEGGFLCFCPEGYYGETCQYPCTYGYGGSNCSDYCLTNALGVSDRNIISDDQMTAYSIYSSSYRAYEGRLNYGGTWRPQYSNDWLQIDFINLVEVYRVANQGNGYGVTQYYLKYSNGGKTFQTYTYGGSIKYFSGYGSSSIYYSNLPAPVKLTHIRFQPTSYRNYPYLRVEVYGCYL